MSATIALVGPSTVPGLPVITPQAIDFAVNAALAANADTAAQATLVEAARAGAAEGVLTAALAAETAARVAAGGNAQLTASLTAWFVSLPTTLPGTAGVLWNNGGSLALS